MKKHVVQFTVSETEYKVLALMAESKGLRTVGQLAKMLVFTAANARPSKGIFSKICGLAELAKKAEISTLRQEDEY